MFKAIFIGAVVLVVGLYTAHAATIYVPDDYPTIQGAIDAAANGDTVIVRTGTYRENLDFLGKAITVTSELVGMLASEPVRFDEQAIIVGCSIAIPIRYVHHGPGDRLQVVVQEQYGNIIGNVVLVKIR